MAKITAARVASAKTTAPRLLRKLWFMAWTHPPSSLKVLRARRIPQSGVSQLQYMSIIQELTVHLEGHREKSMIYGMHRSFSGTPEDLELEAQSTSESTRCGQ